MGYVKAGSKYRVKERFRANLLDERRIDSPEDVNDYLQTYPETILTEEGFVGRISVHNFLDEDYKPRDFLNNQFELFRIDQHFNRNILPEVYEGFMKDFYWVDNSAQEDDYDTRESIFSSYLMTELNIGRYITFIPGVRYEKTNIEYGAYVVEAGPTPGGGPQIRQFRDTLGVNSYGNFFPQIHLRIKPTDWFDIRLAYTNTISRPDYEFLAPKKVIRSSDNEVDLGNTKLDPAISKNYDIILTFFKPQYGLLTLGAFSKEIEGFQYLRNALILAGTTTDPANFGLTDAVLGFKASYPLNNPNLSTIRGFEMDIQSNMNFLPVKGFVLNMNLTLMESKTKYSETLVVRVPNPNPPPRALFVNYDTAYADRLLKQPSILANIALGYDNRKIGLSVRLSFNFQDDILTKEQRRPDAADREGTLAFYRWDFQAKQRITKKLRLRFNVANIFNEPDRATRLITGYYTYVEYYGTWVRLGLSYDIF